MSTSIMNSDKAYLMGLIVGGGVFNGAEMVINLPYKAWGKSKINPERAGEIATDILARVRPLFENTYKMNISFITEPDWQIRSIGGCTSDLLDDMKANGITPRGQIIKTGDLTVLRRSLKTPLLKRHFIAGLADSIGSLNPNHRRFDANYQILSFEFASANNFQLVFDVCQILQEVGCYTDQLLWNHPNLHSPSNPYYTQWKKGYKVRVLIDTYVAACSFVFQAKAEAANQNLATQASSHETKRCDEKGIHEHSVKTVHLHEDTNWLPTQLRGLHFLHNKHICAVMGCPYAPVKDLKAYVKRAEYWINPFPVFFRDSKANVVKTIKDNAIMIKRRYIKQKVSVPQLLKKIEQGEKYIWGNDRDSGYPITEILQGIVWVLQRTEGTTENSRTAGNYLQYLEQEIRSGGERSREITISKPDLMTPLYIHNDKFATLIGPNNPSVYKKLITWHDELRISVRAIEEADLV